MERLLPASENARLFLFTWAAGTVFFGAFLA
jgi:hypothetical protein